MLKGLKAFGQFLLGLLGFKKVVSEPVRQTVAKHISYELKNGNVDAVIGHLDKGDDNQRRQAIEDELDLVYVQNKVTGERHIRSIENHGVRSSKDGSTTLFGRAWFSLRRYTIVNSVLFSAAQFGYFALFQKLLSSLSQAQKQFQFSLTDPQGNTALMLLANAMTIKKTDSEKEWVDLSSDDLHDADAALHETVATLRTPKVNNKSADLQAWKDRVVIETQKEKAQKSTDLKTALKAVFHAGDMSWLVEELQKRNMKGHNALLIAADNDNAYFIDAVSDVLLVEYKNETTKEQELSFLQAMLVKKETSDSAFEKLAKSDETLCAAVLKRFNKLTPKEIFDACMKADCPSVAAEVLRVFDFSINGLLTENWDKISLILGEKSAAWFTDILGKLAKENALSDFYKLKIKGKEPMIWALQWKMDEDQVKVAQALIKKLPETGAAIAFACQNEDVTVALLKELFNKIPAENFGDALTKTVTLAYGMGKQEGSPVSLFNKRDELKANELTEFFDMILEIMASKQVPVADQLKVIAKFESQKSDVLGQQVSFTPCVNNMGTPGTREFKAHVQSKKDALLKVDALAKNGASTLTPVAPVVSITPLSDDDKYKKAKFFWYLMGKGDINQREGFNLFSSKSKQNLSDIAAEFVKDKDAFLYYLNNVPVDKLDVLEKFIDYIADKAKNKDKRELADNPASLFSLFIDGTHPVTALTTTFRGMLADSKEAGTRYSEALILKDRLKRIIQSLPMDDFYEAPNSKEAQLAALDKSFENHYRLPSVGQTQVGYQGSGGIARASSVSASSSDSSLRKQKGKKNKGF